MVPGVSARDQYLHYNVAEDADTTYVITLPYGTKELPTIEYAQGDQYQTIEVVEEGLNAAFIVVTAENGARRTYNVKFEIEKSSNSLLNAIYSNGTILTAFDPEVFDYEIELPYGTNVAPVFTYDLSESGQMVKYQPALSVADTAMFEVTAENGINKSLYRVSFKIVKSDDLDGLENFLARLEKISAKFDISFVLSLSIDADVAPDYVKNLA